jgi:hypothetical protein
MRDPVDLLHAAEQLSVSIPLTENYALERNISWLAIGRGWLRQDDISGALRALRHVDNPRTEAKLRVAIVQWAGQRHETEPVRACVSDTIERIGVFEEHLSRRDVAGLVPTAHHLFGEPTVRRLAGALQDPFNASNVLVALAGLLCDPEARQRTLQQAERLADFDGGDRDFAMEKVYDAYLRAGWEDEAQRILRGMDVKPGYVNEALQKATDALASAERIINPPGRVNPPDLPLARLRRFIEYRCNDVKVHFLVDLANAGYLNNPELEGLIASDAFARIEPPRPPSIYQDPSHFDDESFARFFFDRPVCRHSSDERLLEAHDERQDPEEIPFLARASVLFENFAEIGARFSPEQIDQGLWYLLGRFRLGDMLHSADVPLETRQETIRAMFYPFSHFANAGVEAFFMWWDLVLWRVDESEISEIAPTALEVLDQILKLDSKSCQFAALHGLNHLRPRSSPPSRRASELASQYLAEHRSTLDEKDIAWVEACRDGKAL